MLEQLRIWLIAQGHSLESVNTLPREEVLSLVRLWDCGLIGWRAEHLRAYRLVAAVQALQGVVIKAFGGRPKKPPPFDKMFPETTLLRRKPTLADKLRALREKWYGSSAV